MYLLLLLHPLLLYLLVLLQLILLSFLLFLFLLLQFFQFLFLLFADIFHDVSVLKHFHAVPEQRWQHIHLQLLLLVVFHVLPLPLRHLQHLPVLQVLHLGQVRLLVVVVVDGTLQQPLQTHLLEVGGVEHALLSHQRLQLPLLDALHQDVLLNAVLSYQSVYGHVSGLPYAVAPVLGLLVHGRVPVSVVEYDVAGAGQVQPDAPRPSAADETQHFGVVVEPLHDGLAHFGLGVAVEADVVELEHVEHLLEDVEHLGHLREHQHLLPPLLDVPQQEHHLNQLAAVVQDYALVGEVQQETRPDPLDLGGDHGLDLIAEVLQPVGLGLHIRAHGEGGQVGGAGHHPRNHEQELVEHRLELFRPLLDGGGHVVGHLLLLNLQTAQLEGVDSELLAFGALVVDVCEKQSVCELVPVVLLVVGGDVELVVLPEDVLGHLLETAPEVLDEVPQAVGLVGLEVLLEEHVVGDDDGEGHPVEGGLLDAWLEEVGVVADLLEPHQHVHHARRLAVLLPPVLVPDDLVVEVLLAPAHPASDDSLGLLGQLGLDVLLESSQEEGPQHCVQLLEDLLADGEVLLEGLLEGDVEPLVEVVEGVEDAGHQEVEQGPEFSEVVLEGSAGEEEAAVGLEVEEDLPALGLEVLDVLGLVEDHVVPLLAAEDGVVGDGDLVAGDADVKVVQLRPALPLLLPLLGRPEVGHYLERRAPPLELYLPVHQDRGRHDHQVRPPDAPLYRQVGQQCDGLDGLAQPHLVGQDAVHAPAVQRRHPVHPQQLVLPEGELDQQRGADHVVLVQPDVLRRRTAPYVDHHRHS